MTKELQAYIKIFREFIEWDSYDAIPIIFGAIIPNFGEGDAVFLLFVGPPSTGKTELVRSFDGVKGFESVSNVTPNTFLSGFISKGKKQSEPSEKSLLVRLQKEGKRIIVIKDFTTFIANRSDDKNEVFSQFREIADGYCDYHYGSGEVVRWKGKIGIIASVTGAIEESFAMRQSLGERFLQVRVPAFNAIRAGERSMANTGLEESFRSSLHNAAKDVMESIHVDALMLIETDPDIQSKLFNAAAFLSYARTGVSRDRYSKSLITIPETEGPGRLIRQLTHLGRGIALCLQKPVVDEEVYHYLKMVIVDSVPLVRKRCLYRIWKDELEGNPRQTTQVLSDGLGHSKKTIWYWLDDLKEVGLLAKTDRKEEEDGKSTILWSLSPQGFDMIQSAELFGKYEIPDMEEEYGG